MTLLKKHIVYVLLLCYAATVATGLYLVASGIKIEGSTILGIFSAIVAQTAAIIVAFIKAPEYFSEPEAIPKLQKEHADVVAGLNLQLQNSIKDRENMVAYIGTKIMPNDPKHPLYGWLEEQKRDEQQRIDQSSANQNPTN